MEGDRVYQAAAILWPYFLPEKTQAQTKVVISMNVEHSAFKKW